MFFNVKVVAERQQYYYWAVSTNTHSTVYYFSVQKSENKKWKSSTVVRKIKPKYKWYCSRLKSNKIGPADAIIGQTRKRAQITYLEANKKKAMYCVKNFWCIYKFLSKKKRTSDVFKAKGHRKGWMLRFQQL